MGKMSIVFYRELGFSKSDIGLYSKGIGWLTTVGFTIIGGMVAMRFGTVKALFYAGIAMAGTNLIFTLLAWTGKSTAIFALAVILDDLAAAFANVAFVTFHLALGRPPLYRNAICASCVHRHSGAHVI